MTRRPGTRDSGLAIRTVRSLGVERAGEMAFSSYEEGAPAEGQFRVDTLYTGLSSGTELSFFKGSNPYLHLAWDEELGVFGPGEPSIRFPVRFIGYMEVGRVAESRTAATEPGEIVAMTYGHKTGHTADARHDFWMPLPPEIEPILGIYVAQMGPICANGLLHAAADLGGPTLGDRAADGGRSDPGDAAFLGDGVRGRQVLVVGGGVVGLLTGLFALHHGAASVALADRTPQRLAAAARLGLIPLDEQAGETWRWCKERWRHGPKDRGADVVFQCRGQAAGLQTALRSLRPQGTVIDMAFYQDTFIPTYTEKYGAPQSVFHAHAWDATNMILAAIEAVAIDQDGTLYIPRTALKDALFATSGMVGITGTLDCNENGDCQPSATIAVVTVEGGAFTDTVYSELGTLGS